MFANRYVCDTNCMVPPGVLFRSIGVTREALPSARPHGAADDAVDPLPSLVLWLRLSTIVLSVAVVAVVIRLLSALPSPVDFLVAIAATLIWAYRFER